jgi:hypothetical protein
MWRDFEKAGTWISGGIMFGSLVCGALASMWLNSLDARTAAANSSGTFPASTIEHTVPSDGLATEVIGVGLDKRRMEYIQATN